MNLVFLQVLENVDIYYNISDSKYKANIFFVVPFLIFNLQN